ncbi:hypothetical protein [Leifsonia sp. 1010]|uniref:hypothetical protein n=1 Tax=Leifsonia sp. 1010 TaxID=2817769 RepID=UPI00285BFC53|nr:hypothetical protein [Leifsonia sp. 1010]MDR6611233.1 hypothetical protein [Leifsonia sp. 1010]
MTGADWDVVKNVATVVIASLALLVSVAVAVQASKWRPRPYLQFRFDQTAGHIEQLDLDGFLDRAHIATSGVVMVNITDFWNQPTDSEQVIPGYHVTVANHGSGPAYDVELHIDIPGETSSARMLLGDIVVVRKTVLKEGEEAAFVMSDDIKYGTSFAGRRRWEGLEVWGIGVESDGVKQIGWLTWREPPRNKKVRKRKLEYPNGKRMGEWV